VLLPAILVLFVVVIVYALRPRVQPHREVDEAMPVGPAAEGVKITRLIGGQPDLEASAGKVDQVEDRYHLEDIDRFAVYRTGKPPLIVQAQLGDVEGAEGQRRMRFDGGVVIEDQDEELVLTLPVLEIDEAEGEARSSGELQLEGRTLNGRAGGLTYSLEGRPTELVDVELWDTADGRLVADSALLHDGVADVELVGTVRATRGEEWMSAERLRLIRGPDDVLRTAAAAGAVEGLVSTGQGSPLEMQCETVDVQWDESGEIVGLRLVGAAEVRQGSESLAADTIDAVRRSGLLGSWDVAAEGTVYVQGLMNGEPAFLRAGSIEARLGPAFNLRDAEATGGVSFDGPETRAEGERGRFSIDGNEIELIGDGRNKARLARLQTRVAAESIVTDSRGERLLANGLVEAALLPRVSAGSPAAPGMFRVEEAIHFVSAKLEGTGAGSHLVFSGGVRGWQAERNMAAEKIVLDQEQGRLTATEEVTTRFPRIATKTASEADYVLVSADTLVYHDARRLAVYDGRVRVRVVEGWMEAERMEVELETTEEGIREIRAEGAVRIEFREPGDESAPMVLTGKADRMVYTPADATVRLLGVATPAAVRRIGEGGGTTTGRGLLYHLDTGTLEVDAGDGAPAKIHTKGGS
jgi:lipopolysaccharide transport protein LptA